MVQKKVGSIKKGKKGKAGSEEAKKKNKKEFEKWKESGNHKSSEKYLGKIPRVSKDI